MSRAAWGILQKGGTQLYIRSFELGVLCTPQLEAAYRAHPHYGFCISAPGDLLSLGGAICLPACDSSCVAGRRLQNPVICCQMCNAA